MIARIHHLNCISSCPLAAGGDDHDDGAQGCNPFPFAGAHPPEGATQFGNEVAIRRLDVFVAGGNESGTYVIREVPAMGVEPPPASRRWYQLRLDGVGKTLRGHVKRRPAARNLR